MSQATPSSQTASCLRKLTQGGGRKFSSLPVLPYVGVRMAIYELLSLRPIHGQVGRVYELMTRGIDTDWIGKSG